MQEKQELDRRLAAAFRNFANRLGAVRNSYDDIDADTAFTAAVESVKDAAEDLARDMVDSLEVHPQDDSIRQVIPVKCAASEMDRAQSLDPEHHTDASDCGVVGQSLINIPGIKKGKFVLIIDDERGDLSVELLLVEQIVGGDKP